MEELPYWRVVMARKQREHRRMQFATEHAEVVELVHRAIRERGPLGARDFATAEQARAGATKGKGTFRSGKVVNQALYYLWIAGDLMTHSRKGLEYVYDLRERICPASLDQIATHEEADAFFALKTLQQGGMLSAQEWKNWYAGIIQRFVSAGEVRDRLETLLKEGSRLKQRIPVLLDIRANKGAGEFAPCPTIEMLLQSSSDGTRLPRPVVVKFDPPFEQSPEQFKFHDEIEIVFHSRPDTTMDQR